MFGWIFLPLWLFHVVVARGRFSLPAPSMPHGRYWAPFHAIVATPLLIMFELLLCVHLERNYERMCRPLMPREEKNIIDETIWKLSAWTPVVKSAGDAQSAVHMLKNDYLYTMMRSFLRICYRVGYDSTQPFPYPKVERLFPIFETRQELNP
ncbi:hypothetical protein OROGR_014877 [Orobanche gracilis]